jgi:CBS domain-containing protein
VRLQPILRPLFAKNGGRRSKPKVWLAIIGEAGEPTGKRAARAFAALPTMLSGRVRSFATDCLTPGKVNKMSGVNSQLVAGTIEQLRAHPPFDTMLTSDLTLLVNRLKLAYFPKGATILAGDSGVVSRLHIVQRGHVSASGANSDESVLALATGECFPVGALIGRRATTLSYRAQTDVFCYLLDQEGFDHLMDVSVAFRNFCLRRIAHLLAESHRQTTQDYHRRAALELSMASPLKAAIRRDPITASPDTPIRQILTQMRDLRIGSVAVVDAHKRPIGIFTQTDVIDRVALSGVDLATPVEALMTREPFKLESSMTLADAATAMARRRFRHVLVVEGELLVGVISERDLFTLQRLSLQSTAKEIASANDLPALVHAAKRARQVCDAMLAQGIAAEQLTQFVTTLNDTLVERAFALSAQQVDLGSIRLCWIGLGSEGRMEQTFATDQDNAIIFQSDGDDVEASRGRLIAFADVMNRALAELGFPLCEGDIMARNPKWCMTLDEWKSKFGQWLTTPDPDALLSATIFFDFRALMGDESMAEELRAYLTARAPEGHLFLRLLAENALNAKPPLNILGELATDDDGYIDLKKSGARLFVDAARLFALAQGVAATNTAQRLRQSGERMRMSDDEVSAAIDAFHFIQMLRLKQQQNTDVHTPATPAGGEHTDEPSPESTHAGPASAARDASNRIRPGDLNNLESRILKEAFRQARKLQSRVRLDYLR